MSGPTYVKGLDFGALTAKANQSNRPEKIGELQAAVSHVEPPVTSLTFAPGYAIVSQQTDHVSNPRPELVRIQPYSSSAPTSQPSPPLHTKEDHLESFVQPPVASKRWKGMSRKARIVTLLVAVFVLIAIVIGAAVGVTQSKAKSRVTSGDLDDSGSSGGSSGACINYCSTNSDCRHGNSRSSAYCTQGTYTAKGTCGRHCVGV
jgi:hypothetical protein